jgi:hypothetical protein
LFSITPRVVVICFGQNDGASDVDAAGAAFEHTTGTVLKKRRK